MRGLDRGVGASKPDSDGSDAILQRSVTRLGTAIALQPSAMLDPWSLDGICPTDLASAVQRGPKKTNPPGLDRATKFR